MSPRCGCLDVVSQLPPRFLPLLVSRPLVAKMWSPSCLPDVVSQVLSPSCLQRFYTCCLVFHLSPRCGFPDAVSQSGCCLVVFDLSPRCGLSVPPLDLVSQMLAPALVVVSLSSTSFPDAVSQLSPRYGFRGVVSHSCCCLVVFHPSPR